MTIEEAIEHAKEQKEIFDGIHREFLDIAIKAIEKCVPMKPKVYEDKYYACKCGNPVLMKYKKYPIELMPKKFGLNFCLSCGQRLDWTEE